MAKINKLFKFFMKYIRTIWNEKSVEGKDTGRYIYFSKINISDRTEDMKVVYYPDGQIKAANSTSGYLGEEIAEGPLWTKSIDELNQPPELITTEITKEEFESEWNKAISQPGFKLTPYAWLKK